MRDSIARILVWALRLLLPAHGRHQAHNRPEPAPMPAEPAVSPWARPWTGPTKEEAAAYFRQQAETTMPLAQVQKERRAALEFTALEHYYPYSYPGAPFPGRRSRSR
ncbi:hypothetical protein SSPIM334S_07657 [Streptomyces spiroverticillatus]